MRRLLASAVVIGLGLALSWAAFGQQPPVARTQRVTVVAGAAGARQEPRATVSVTLDGQAASPAPTSAAALTDGHVDATGVGVRIGAPQGLSAHAKVRSIRWLPVAPGCVSRPIAVGCPRDAPLGGVQQGEVGAGYVGHGVKLDLSIGHGRSGTGAGPARASRFRLPRVLPAAGGADVAAPLWFRNSTSTSITARGQVSLTPDTSLDLGASLGRVHLLPGSGLASEDVLDQTTLSLGVRRGAVRGAIVGHMLQPDLPGMPLGQDQAWSGIDLGISVRLPWRGELNFGARNMWTSGHAPLLLRGGSAVPDQGRVPYVQYHQDL